MKHVILSMCLAATALILALLSLPTGSSSALVSTPSPYPYPTWEIGHPPYPRSPIRTPGVVENQPSVAFPIWYNDSPTFPETVADIGDRITFYLELDGFTQAFTQVNWVLTGPGIEQTTPFPAPFKIVGATPGHDGPIGPFVYAKWYYTPGDQPIVITYTVEIIDVYQPQYRLGVMAFSPTLSTGYILGPQQNWHMSQPAIYMPILSR